MESDPEEFARTFCADMGIEDPEVGVGKFVQPNYLVYDLKFSLALLFAIAQWLRPVCIRSLCALVVLKFLSHR